MPDKKTEARTERAYSNQDHKDKSTRGKAVPDRNEEGRDLRDARKLEPQRRKQPFAQG